MRRFYLILLSLCIMCTGIAQNSIIGYRYWFNSDISITNVEITPATDLDLEFEMNIAGLPNGLNVLHLQLLDDALKYSSAVSGFFYKMPANNNLIAGYRYWFNNAVSEMTNVAVTPTTHLDLSTAINTESLKEGLNVLHLSFYNESGIYSAAISTFVTKLKVSSTDQPGIVAYEYWFNNDIEQVVSATTNPTSELIINHIFETDDILKGLHRFNIRFKDEKGLWSQLQSSYFYKPSEIKSNNHLITEYEYWLNNNRSLLTSVVLDQPTDPLELTLILDMEPQAVGNHTFHFRSKDTYGHWSVVSTDTFHRAEIPLLWTEQTIFCDSAIVVLNNNTDSLKYNYLWQFGDGSSSQAFAPVHKYPNPGNYRVSLTATDKISLKDTTEHLMIYVGKTFLEILQTKVEIGDSIEWRGQFYHEAGNYHEILQSTLGCDSIYILELTVTDSLISAPKDIILHPDTIRENEAPGTYIGSFTAVDLDEDDTHVFTLFGGDEHARNAFFFIEGNQLFAKYSFDFETLDEYVILVEVEDAQGYKFKRFLSVWIKDVNEAPDSLIITANKINENEPVGTFIGELQALDADFEEQFSYRFINGEGDEDNNLFGIDSNKLFSKAVFDYEQKSLYNIRIQVSDKGGLAFSQTFAIQVIDQNERPSAINISNHQILENQPVGKLIGKFTTEDQDADEVFTYSFTSGENDIDNGHFLISGDSLLAGAVFDFEKKNTYFIRIKVEDKAGATFSRSFTIVILDIDETPVPIIDIRMTGHSINENMNPGTFIGKLSTIGGIGPEYKYQFITGDGDYDNAQFEISGDSLFALITFDFESRSLYFTRIQTTDAVGAIYSKLMLILVNDINETPYGMYITNTTMDELLPQHSLVGTLFTFDQDRSDVHTYSLIDGEGAIDNDLFIIRNDSLLTNEVLVYDQKSIYSIRIQTRDKGGMTYSMKVTVFLNRLSGLNLTSDSRYLALVQDDLLIIKAPSEESNLRIELFNILGTMILQENLLDNNQAFRLNGIPHGVYVLNFIENQRVVQQRRLIR